MSFTLLIDESGDEGIQPHQIASGASPMFFFGAFLIETKDISFIQNEILSMEKLIGKEAKGLHFKKIRHHSKKIRCCKNIAQLPGRAFGLISDKSQLDREDYRQELQKWPGGYYNKNAAYLMEIVGKYCLEKNIEIEKIIFEEKNNHDYQRMRNYLCAVRDDKYGYREQLNYRSGWHHEADNLKPFDFKKLVEAKPKAEEPGLKVSDAIANSLNNACIADEYQNTENKYIQCMKNLFPSGPNGKILNFGIKPVINFDAMQMSLDDKSFFQNLTHDAQDFSKKIVSVIQS